MYLEPVIRSPDMCRKTFLPVNFLFLSSFLSIHRAQHILYTDFDHVTLDVSRTFNITGSAEFLQAKCDFGRKTAVLRF